MSFKGKELNFKFVKVLNHSEDLDYIIFRCENKEQFILDLATNTLKFRGYNEVSLRAMAEVLAWADEYKVVTTE